MKKVKLKFIQDNYAWIVAIITGISVFFTFAIKFLNYLHSKIEFSYFGLDYGMYVVEDTGFIYNFCFSILIALCFYSLCYCYYQIFKMIKNRKYEVKLLLENIVLILLSNVYIIFSSGIKISWQTIFFELSILFILEIIITVIIGKMVTKELKKETDTKDFLNYLKKLPFSILFIILLFLFTHVISIINNTEYRIINDNKVIVYVNNDYYLVLDCEIMNDEIKIYKGTQTKIDNLNIESKLYDFRMVNIVDD